MTRTYDTKFKGIAVRVLLDCERQKVTHYTAAEHKGRDLGQEHFSYEDVPVRLVRVNEIANNKPVELTDEEDDQLFDEAREYFGK